MAESVPDYFPELVQSPEFGSARNWEGIPRLSGEGEA